jgi:hypothetical protein
MKGAMKPGGLLLLQGYSPRSGWNIAPAGCQLWKTTIPMRCCGQRLPIGKSIALCEHEGVINKSAGTQAAWR